MLIPSFIAQNLFRIKSIARAVSTFSFSMDNNATTSRIMEPDSVCGMNKLDRSKFTKEVDLPILRIPKSCVSQAISLNSVRSSTITRTSKLKAIMDTESKDTKLLVFNPDALVKLGDRSIVINEIQKVANEKLELEFESMKHEFNYEEWDTKSILRAVLPPGIEFSGFAQVGHIAHLNLREDLLPYKFVIAEILHDKISWIKTVVNKLNAIDNEFRFFEMELLAGEPEYVTTVFWNSRLTNVHNLMIKRFNHHSIVFDIFAGVGPFVLPAIKLKGAKKCFANDLNPESIRSLEENMELNKVPKDRIMTFNLDGSEFIKKVMPSKFAELSVDDDLNANFHAVMNLPCLAVEFLKHFKNCFSLYPETVKFFSEFFKSHPFHVYCHLFVKAYEDHPREWFRNEAENLVRDRMGLPDLQILETHYIRKVAAFKEMFCVVFQLPVEYGYNSINSGINENLRAAPENPKKRNVDLQTVDDTTVIEHDFSPKIQKVE